MTKYREILRLKSLGFSERNIAHSCGVSRNTVAKVVKKAAEIKLSWPLDHDMTDSTLEEMLFPKTKSATNKRMPDYDYIRRELLRNGVNKKLLWVEYCEECRMNGEEPLMYSQFCYYIQKDEEKRRATMHIPRGNTAEILIGVYMAEQPVFGLHVAAELRINIAAAGKDPYKQVCGNRFPGNRIFNWQSPACPVHFHGISGFMMDPHSGFGFFCPCPVNVTKLCEYYGAAEPPVRRGVSHLSGLTEPPVYSYSA